MIRYLSHPLSKNIPVYGLKKASIRLSEVKSLRKGDSCQVYSFTMENRWGTHVDGSAHFFDHCPDISGFEASAWCFHHPQVIDVSLKPGDLLALRHLPLAIRKNVDMVLFKSGWSKKRNQTVYSHRNPGLHPKLASYIRAECPSVRAIGIDWVSISSYQHRELGRLAHKALLNPELPQDPVFIIEDMDLSKAIGKLRKVVALPLRVEGMDSAPCTVIGFF